ncbi:MAG TPA: MerR family transcriptional regulator [Pseudomonas sp.]|nr:MerR family transcriptional regulator [Pseudomonas sp.]
MLIAELERQSGLSRDTIRYYERIGLLPAAPRRSNGYRDYDAHALVVLNFIRAAQEVGFSLDQLRAALPHLRQPPERCAELLAALAGKRVEILQQIATEKARLRRLDRLLQRVQGG